MVVLRTYRFFFLLLLDLLHWLLFLRFYPRTRRIAAIFAGMLAKILIKKQHLPFALKQLKESGNPALIKGYLLGLFNRRGWVYKSILEEYHFSSKPICFGWDLLKVSHPFCLLRVWSNPSPPLRSRWSYPHLLNLLFQPNFPSIDACELYWFGLIVIWFLYCLP